MEAFADAVGLWSLHFGLGVIDVVQRQVQLVVMPLGLTAVFGATISQNAQHW